jgi:hypothetical protein
VTSISIRSEVEPMIDRANAPTQMIAGKAAQMILAAR